MLYHAATLCEWFFLRRGVITLVLIVAIDIFHIRPNFNTMISQFSATRLLKTRRAHVHQEGHWATCWVSIDWLQSFYIAMCPRQN